MLFLFPLAAAVLQFRDDADLIKRLKARDGTAMAELYDRYGKLTFSLILRVVRNEAVAEDLVQEAFLRVWNRMAAFDANKGALGPWILTVARNRAIDYLRSLDGRLAANSVELDKLEQPKNFERASDRALEMDRARVLAEAFRKLTDQQRQVIELAYYEGLSQTEMAARMKQPLGTVKTWVRTALRTLRDEMEGAAA